MSHPTIWDCRILLRLSCAPVRTNVAANTGIIEHLYRRELAIALGALMSFVADNPKCKVTSMLARLRGVARRHTALGLKFVSLQLVVVAADGLVQEHVDLYGHDSLLDTVSYLVGIETAERRDLESVVGEYEITVENGAGAVLTKPLSLRGRRS